MVKLRTVSPEDGVGAFHVVVEGSTGLTGKPATLIVSTSADELDWAPTLVRMENV